MDPCQVFALAVVGALVLGFGGVGLIERRYAREARERRAAWRRILEGRKDEALERLRDLEDDRR